MLGNAEICQGSDIDSGFMAHAFICSSLDTVYNLQQEPWLWSLNCENGSWNDIYRYREQSHSVVTAVTIALINNYNIKTFSSA